MIDDCFFNVDDVDHSISSNRCGKNPAVFGDPLRNKPEGNNHTDIDHHNRANNENHNRQNSNHEQDYQSSSGSANTVIDKLGEAYATFELNADTITKEKLRKRYKELMLKLHPDQSGSSKLAAILNADYDTLLEAHGWKR